MGAYRLFLAFCVLESHVFGAVMGWDIGVVAVISFLIMSGYVMAMLVGKYYPTIASSPAFYADRAARLFPQYLFYLVAILLCAHFIGLNAPFLYNRGPIYILLNALILPLGFYMFGLNTALYNPPAWSLGLEFCFYLVFPFFWQLPSRWKYVCIALSLVVSIIALTGTINSDWFGYRLLPGTFFIFIIGTALARPDKISRYYPAFIGGLAAVALVVVMADKRLYDLPYTREVLGGIVVGVIVVSFLKSKRFSQIDEFLSNLSYGVYLNHFLVLMLVQHYHLSLFLVPAVSPVLAYVSYNLVEKPALRWRHHLRKKFA